jgi:integrase
MQGHVRKRGNKWCAVVFLGIGDDGKRKYKWFSGYNTKKEAQVALTKILQDMNTGIYVNPSQETLGSYLQSWLEGKRSQVRAGTFRSYEWLVNKHIVPHIGKVVLSKLQPRHLQKLYTELQEGDDAISNRSILHAHRILHQALDQAMKWGMVQRNVAKLVDPPKPRRMEMQVWDEDQLEAFLEFSRRSRYHIAFALLASTGMRVGEALALTWDNVDFDAKKIRVTRALSYTGKGYKFEEPKTDSGRRSIDLPPSMVAALKKHKATQAEERLRAGTAWQENGLVICTSIGTPVLQHNLRMLFARMVKNAGLPPIRLHDLRHTHATILLKKGVHPKIVQERLGHSDITVTLNTYSHVIPGLQEAAALAIDSIFTQKEPQKIISGDED